MAQTECMRQALFSEEAMEGQHEAVLNQILEHLQRLSTSVAQLSRQLSYIVDQLLSSTPSTESLLSPTPAAEMSTPQAREPYIPIRTRYSGDLGTSAQFLHHCSLVFDQQPATYGTHKSKITFVMSLLCSQATAWALAVSSQSPELCSDYDRVTDEIKKVFDHPVSVT